jgi:mannosyltransferase OCH1-like enzyme
VAFTPQLPVICPSLPKKKQRSGHLKQTMGRTFNVPFRRGPNGNRTRTKKQASPPANKHIPFVLYQTWKSHRVTEGMYKAMRSFAHLNTRLKRYLFNDDEARNWLVEQEEKKTLPQNIVRAYDSLIPGAYKADLWRYCILYVNGGYYADVKMRLLLPFRRLVRPSDRFIFVRDGGSRHVYNAFMASAPRNKILLLAIQQSIRNILTRNYGRNSLDITGPAVLGRAYNRWRGRYDRAVIRPGIYKRHQILRHWKARALTVFLAKKKGHVKPKRRHLFRNAYKEYYRKDNRKDAADNYRVAYHSRRVFR